MGIRGWRGGGRPRRGEGERERERRGAAEERFGRGRDEERFALHGERRFGTARDEGRYAREEGRPWREEGPAGRAPGEEWGGGVTYRPEFRGRSVDEGPYPRHPMSHRYRGYEEEPEPFTGPAGTDVRREGSTASFDTWGFGGGTPGYTGWGMERFGDEAYRGHFGGYPAGRMDENVAGGTAFPRSPTARGLSREYPTERSAPRRGRGPRSYQRSDERIREEVNERLMMAWMNSEDVDVRVENGEVTLTGFVDTREEKRAIEDVAADVLGVKDVHNQLRVDAERRQRDRDQGRLTEEQSQRH